MAAYPSAGRHARALGNACCCRRTTASGTARPGRPAFCRRQRSSEMSKATATAGRAVCRRDAQQCAACSGGQVRGIDDGRQAASQASTREDVQDLEGIGRGGLIGGVARHQLAEVIRLQDLPAFEMACCPGRLAGPGGPHQQDQRSGGKIRDAPDFTRPGFQRPGRSPAMHPASARRRCAPAQPAPASALPRWRCPSWSCTGCLRRWPHDGWPRRPGWHRLAASAC